MQPLSGKNENILCILWLVPGRGGAKECYPAAIPLTKPTTTDSNSNQLQRTPTTTTATFTPPPPHPPSHILTTVRQNAPFPFFRFPTHRRLLLCTTLHLIPLLLPLLILRTLFALLDPESFTASLLARDRQNRQTDASDQAFSR